MADSFKNLMLDRQKLILEELKPEARRKLISKRPELKKLAKALDNESWPEFDPIFPAGEFRLINSIDDQSLINLWTVEQNLKKK